MVAAGANPYTSGMGRILGTIPLGLAAWAFGGTVPTEAATLPDRGQVQTALDAWLACPDQSEPSCRPPPHIVLSASRCWPDLPGPERAGRVICLFSGLVSGGSGPATRIDKNCVYLAADSAGTWRFVAIVDEDICAEYR